MATTEEVGILLLDGTKASFVNDRVADVVRTIYGSEMTDNILQTIGKRKPTFKRWVADRQFGRDSSVNNRSPLHAVIRACILVDKASTAPELYDLPADLNWQIVFIICKGFPSLVKPMLDKIITSKNVVWTPGILAALTSVIREFAWMELDKATIQAFYKKAKELLARRENTNTGTDASASGTILGALILNLLSMTLLMKYEGEAGGNKIGHGLANVHDADYSECATFIQNMRRPYAYDINFLAPYARSAVRDTFPFALPNSLDLDRYSPEENIHRAGRVAEEWRSGGRSLIVSEASRIIGKVCDILSDSMPEKRQIEGDLVKLREFSLFAPDPVKAFTMFAQYTYHPGDGVIQLFSSSRDTLETIQAISAWCEENNVTLSLDNIRALTY